MNTISNLLKKATFQLSHVADNPQLEAEILLAHVLKSSRSYLHTWPEKEVDLSQTEQFELLIARRLKEEPIAYLTGHREFWSLDFSVTPDVLIPRPETEVLVELVLQTMPQEKAIVADLGVGSGVIALALAYEKKDWEIHATDRSPEALAVASRNAKNLNITNVIFHEGSWCKALPPIKFDVIVSNPPYIDKEDVHLSKLGFEPVHALISKEQGFFDLYEIISQAREFLKPNGFLFLEHGASQAKKVATHLEKSGYTSINTFLDLARLDRVTRATWLGYTL